EETLSVLRGYGDDLPALFIVSKVELGPSPAGDIKVEVVHAEGQKCERCWNWSTTIGADLKYPTIDARCIRQIEEGWR
ncbi:MAG: hypothetical protein ACREDR_39440, partial [Blastocatellia bacterium]